MAFLPPFVEAGGTLFWETRATGIRERRSGVEVFVQGAAGRRLLRGRRVVIAAGALSTPHLVRTNKLGSQRGQVGRGLRIHPASKVFGLMPEPLERGGIPQGLGYHTPVLDRITFEGVHTPATAAAPMMMAAGPQHRRWMEQYDRLVTYGMMCRDRNTGRIHQIGSTRTMDYALHPDDARDLGAAAIWVARAMFEAGAERVLLPIQGTNPEFSSDALDGLKPEDFTPSNIISMGFHPQGSAAMGRVVDPNLKLIGSDAIYIADASVMPDSPGVNPQVTIMGLALRLSQHLHERA